MLQLLTTSVVKLTEENIELLFYSIMYQISLCWFNVPSCCGVTSEVYARHPRSEHVYALNCNQEVILAEFCLIPSQ